MRTEVMMAAVLATGGATAVAVSSCGDDNKKSGTTAKPAATQATTPVQTATAPPKPQTLVVRVDGRRTRVRISEISFAYCRKSPAVCAAIKSGQEKQLTPNQRRAVAAARETIREQESAPPAPEPAPEPAPAPAPVPEPAPEGTSTG